MRPEASVEELLQTLSSLGWGFPQHPLLGVGTRGLLWAGLTTPFQANLSVTLLPAGLLPTEWEMVLPLHGKAGLITLPPQVSESGRGTCVTSARAVNQRQTGLCTSTSLGKC